jgi:hypothetical protein
MQQLTPERLVRETKNLHFSEVLVYSTSAVLVFNDTDTIEFAITDPSRLVSFCGWKKIRMQQVKETIVPGKYVILGDVVRGPSNVTVEHLLRYAEEHNCRTFGHGYATARYITVE